MSKGKKHMNLMNCHAARIYFPRGGLVVGISMRSFPHREILISRESLSLRELKMQVLLYLELYRILKNDAVSGVPSVR